MINKLTNQELFKVTGFLDGSMSIIFGFHTVQVQLFISNNKPFEFALENDCVSDRQK